MRLYDTEIAIVIPALNEEHNLVNTLSMIRKLLGSTEGVILADNGSTDRTLEVAAHFGIKTIVHAGVSIAALRNRGAAKTQADIIVFIDSDILLDSSWPKQFAKTVKQIKANAMLITGSRCRAINKETYVGHYWYNRLNHNESKNYINSGHIIVSRKLFQAVGGFNESLQTGEDYDFCQRALKIGAIIKPNENLIVWHDGYPDSISDFMAREMWHGKDEFNSLTSILKSHVAIASLALTISLAISLFFTLLQWNLMPLAYYVGVWFILLLGLSVQKFGFNNIKTTFHSAILYYLYLLSRSLAWMFKARRPSARN